MGKDQRMKEVNINEGKNYKIKDDAIVKITPYNNGNEIQIKDSLRIQKNLKKSIVKKSKDKFLDTRTNQIRDYQHNNSKNDKGIKRAMSKLRKLLKNNFFGYRNELFITLTCEEIIKDVDLIVRCFKQFWNKLQNIYKSLAYAYVIEMQEERQSLHIHVLVKDMKNSKLIIKNNKIRELWGQGHTKTSKISNHSKVNSINEENMIKKMEKEDEKLEASDDETDGADTTSDNKNNKQSTYGINAVISYMIKSKSKENIPSNKQLYHSSKCLKYPEEIEMQYKKVKEMIMNDYKLKDEHTILIQDPETGKIINKHKTETYEKK